MIEDNLIKQLYCFRSEQFKGGDSDFKFENLNELLEDLSDQYNCVQGYFKEGFAELTL